MTTTKLNQLTTLEGFDDPLDLLEHAATDSACPGICLRAECSYTTEVEPDCEAGWCPSCSLPSVASALILAGLT